MRKILIIFFFSSLLQSQSIDINNDFNYSLIKKSILLGEINPNISLNIRPIQTKSISNLFENKFKTLYSNNTIQIKSLGIDYFVEYNSHHPYNRNNGTMIPNRGYQHIISPGLYFKIGPLSIQLKPEHHFAENRNFDVFWDGHDPYVWSKRYKLWNKIDMPERFGNKSHNKTTFGQSSIKFNWNKISLGISNENIWWGPALRNSIMMSNNAEGFKHITFNSNEPIITPFGNFEWQLISGRLENSGFEPTGSDYEYAGTRLYVPKINQRGDLDDWRYLQGLIISYSPKWIDGLSIGFIRWVQMYSALVEGRYPWLDGSPKYFPVFQNLFRKNDKFENYEAQTNQAAGLFLNWIWRDSNAQFYLEFHHNDSKQNLRDLLLDSDHSRAATIGIQKVFKLNNSDFIFHWEWTQMEQNASRLVRNAGSWYEHSWVFDGYTNKGEVLGSSIGPGSNSHYLSISKINKNEKIGLGIEVVDQDNDFYHEAFASAKDQRRYWKDFNLHIDLNKSFKRIEISSKLVFIRSLNYQWEIDDTVGPYYQPGRDVNNFHVNLKISYFGFW